MEGNGGQMTVHELGGYTNIMVTDSMNAVAQQALYIYIAWPLWFTFLIIDTLRSSTSSIIISSIELYNLYVLF